MNNCNKKLQKCRQCIEDNKLENYCFAVPPGSPFDDPYQGIMIAEYNSETGKPSYMSVDEFMNKFHIK